MSQLYTICLRVILLVIGPIGVIVLSRIMPEGYRIAFNHWGWVMFLTNAYGFPIRYILLVPRIPFAHRPLGLYLWSEQKPTQFGLLALTYHVLNISLFILIWANDGFVIALWSWLGCLICMLCLQMTTTMGMGLYHNRPETELFWRPVLALLICVAILIAMNNHPDPPKFDPTKPYQVIP